MKYSERVVEGEDESSNHYHDFVPAKGLFRRLGRSICTNDRRDYMQDT